MLSSESLEKGELKASAPIFDKAKKIDGPSKQLPTSDRSKSRDAGKRHRGGGKAIWNRTEQQIDVLSIDSGDPNFDSEAEENVILESTDFKRDDYDFGPPPLIRLSEFKVRCVDIITEYFVSGDVDEVTRSLTELQSEVFHYEFVKRAVTMSMDKHEKEMELTSRLLSDLYPRLLKMEHIGKGFERLLESSDDLQLDIPNARGILATYLARSVVDEILPPSYLANPMVASIGGGVVELAKKKLSINHGIVRLEKGWGPGDGRPVEELKVAVDQLLQEYLLSSDLGEAAHCVRELNVPHFHHEVVKRAVVHVLDKTDLEQKAMSSLLAYLVTQEVVSSDQVSRGFEKLKQGLSDLMLDYPNASTVIETFVSQAQSDGIVA